MVGNGLTGNGLTASTTRQAESTVRSCFWCLGFRVLVLGGSSPALICLPAENGSAQEGLQPDGEGLDEPLPSNEPTASFDVLPEPKPRVLGPSMPPRELLEQAAEVAEAVSNPSWPPA